MRVEHLCVLVEEVSMERALRGLLPRLLGDISFEVFTFQGKADLLRKLPARLTGYARSLPASHRVVVLVDRDNEDCLALKSRMEAMATSAGLRVRSQWGLNWQIVNRVVVEELESWYFGDWEAVLRAYPRMPPNVPERAGFRVPDEIAGGTAEAFERVARRAGYFRGGLRKVEMAERISAFMDCSLNRSRSFQVFRDALLETLDEVQPLP